MNQVSDTDEYVVNRLLCMMSGDWNKKGLQATFSQPSIFTQETWLASPFPSQFQTENMADYEDADDFDGDDYQEVDEPDEMEEIEEGKSQIYLLWIDPYFVESSTKL